MPDASVIPVSIAVRISSLAGSWATDALAPSTIRDASATPTTLIGPQCNWCDLRRHEGGELALERLRRAVAPPLGDRLGGGIREDVLFAPRQPIEDSLSGGLGGGLWDVEVSVHVGVD